MTREEILACKIVAVILLITIFSLIFYNNYRSKKYWNITCDSLTAEAARQLQREGAKAPPGADDSEDVSFTDMLYFSTVTTFTIGYGDITPKTNEVKILVIIKIILSSIILIY
jgi:uncharacterized membrane protein